MEALTLQQLSLILDEDIVILQEDVQKNASKNPLKSGNYFTNGDDGNSTELPSLAGSLAKQSLPEENRKLRYEGGFEKAILIVFQGDTLKSSHREFLIKIMGAVDCSLDDVALVSSSHLLELPAQSIEQLNPIKSLVFGELDHPIMRHKTSNYEFIGGETNYFFADTLEDLEESIPLKRNLWTGLQVLFQIKK